MGRCCGEHQAGTVDEEATLVVLPMFPTQPSDTEMSWHQLNQRDPFEIAANDMQPSQKHSQTH